MGKEEVVEVSKAIKNIMKELLESLKNGEFEPSQMYDKFCDKLDEKGIELPDDAEYDACESFNELLHEFGVVDTVRVKHLIAVLEYDAVRHTPQVLDGILELFVGYGRHPRLRKGIALYNKYSMVISYSPRNQQEIETLMEVFFAIEEIIEGSAFPTDEPTIIAQDWIEESMFASLQSVDKIHEIRYNPTEPESVIFTLNDEPDIEYVMLQGH